MDSTQIVLFPHHYRWLNGYEYKDILLSAFDHQIPIFDSHPQEIYNKPKNGYLYFLRSTSLNQIGFPRLQDNSPKLFKWKKMNFQTLLPKNKPQVIYIVCKCILFNYIINMINSGLFFVIYVKLIFKYLQYKQIDKPQLNQYEEIRNCKKRLVDCMERSFEVAFEAQQIQIKLQLFDEDLIYIYQKIYTQEQRQEIMKLYLNLTKQNESLRNELKDCEEVILKYDQL